MWKYWTNVGSLTSLSLAPFLTPTNAGIGYDMDLVREATGDVIVISVGRNGTSGADPNSGNFYFYGISFEYSSDM